MALLKLTESQLQEVKKDPIYYNLNILKTKNGYEVECTGTESKQIKELVDT